MSNDATEFYLNILKDLLGEYFDYDYYCIGGQQDSSVCLEKNDEIWTVYGCNRLSRIDEKEYSTIVEAAMDMLSRLCDAEEEAILKSNYCMRIYQQLTA